MATQVTGGPKAAAGTVGVNVSEREDLANFISNITRDETPFMSSIGKTKATAILHEWQTDELAAPTNSAIAEGTDVTSAGPGLPQSRQRLGNYCQINSKELKVSGTKRAVDQAGVADEYAYQLKKRGIEMRRDMEWALVQGWQESTGTGTRKAAGVQAFCAPTNVYRADSEGFIATGHTRTDSAITYTENTDVNWTSSTNPGTGTFGTLTRAGTTEIELVQIDEVMQQIYEEGGKATRIMVSPKNRRTISSKAQAAGSNVRRNIDDSGKLRQSVDIYVSDFGDLMVEPNYIMGLSNAGGANGSQLNSANNSQDFTAILYDPMWFNMATLRPMQEVDVGQVGDSTLGMMVEEWTLEVTNPFGFGLIVGLA